MDEQRGGGFSVSGETGVVVAVLGVLAAALGLLARLLPQRDPVPPAKRGAAPSSLVADQFKEALLQQLLAERREEIVALRQRDERQQALIEQLREQNDRQQEQLDHVEGRVDAAEQSAP